MLISVSLSPHTTENVVTHGLVKWQVEILNSSELANKEAKHGKYFCLIAGLSCPSAWQPPWGTAAVPCASSTPEPAGYSSGTLLCARALQVFCKICFDQHVELLICLGINPGHILKSLVWEFIRLLKISLQTTSFLMFLCGKLKLEVWFNFKWASLFF